MDTGNGYTVVEVATKLFSELSISQEVTTLTSSPDDHTTANLKTTEGGRPTTVFHTTDEDEVSFLVSPFSFPTAAKDVATTKSSTSIDKSLNNPETLVAVLSVAIVVIFLLVVVSAAWKCKLKKKVKQVSSYGHPESSSGMQTKAEMYENIKQWKPKEGESNYENTGWRAESHESNICTILPLHEQRYCNESKEIIGDKEADTPDGTYETPDADYYSYADPKELRTCPSNEVVLVLM